MEKSLPISNSYLGLVLGPEGQREGHGVKVVGGSVVVEQFCEEGKGLLME